MNKKITGKVLTVQIGAEQTLVALADKSGSIVHTAAVPTPEGAVDDGAIVDTAAVTQMLKSVIRRPEFRKIRRAVFVLCTSQVIAAVGTVPTLTGKKLEKLLNANADVYFPVDVTDYRLVWQIIGPCTDADNAGKQNVQIWAVPNGLIPNYYLVANACGLAVTAIDYFCHSMASAVGTTFAAGKKKLPAEDVGAEAPQTLLHLLLERDVIGLSLSQGGHVVLQRALFYNGDPSTQFGEMSMILEYFRTLEIGRNSAVRGIACGALATDAELVSELSAVLGIPTEVSDAPYAPEFCLCAGAAHTELDFGLSTLNAPDKSRQYQQSQLLQYALVLAGGLAVFGALTLIQSARLDWSADIGNLESKQQVLSLQAGGVSGYYDAYSKYQNAYSSYSGDWETIFANMQTYNDNLVLVFEELEQIMPENASVAGVSIGADGMGPTFACEDKEVAAYLIMQLRQLQYADLLSISDLQGGGGGPASPDAGEEDPGDDPAPLPFPWDELHAALAEDLDVYNVAYYLTASRLDALQNSKYCLTPSNTYGSYDELKAAAGDTLTKEIRKKAFSALYQGNPFVIAQLDATFSDRVMLLLTDPDLYWAMLMGGFGSELTDHDSPADLEQDVRETCQILLTLYNYDGLSAVENILCADPDLEKWYVYYLETALAGQDPNELFYLNTEKAADDVAKNDGSFNYTKDAALNEALNGLIGGEDSKTYALVKDLDFDAYDLNGEVTAEDVREALSEDLDAYRVAYSLYFANKNSRYLQLLNACNYGLTLSASPYGSYEAFHVAYGDLSENIQKRVVTALCTTNPFAIAGAWELLTTDPQFSDYAPMLSALEPKSARELESLMTNTILPFIRDKASYRAKLEQAIFDGDDEEMKQWYLYYLDAALAGNDPAALPYLNTEAMVIDLMDGGAYNSGSDALNEKLNALSEQTGSLIEGLYVPDDTTDPSDTVDTRIYFTVTLSYSDALRNAELVRKDLDHSEKVEELEVAQG